MLSSVIRPQIRLLDIGAGAGFPGIPLKIYNPTMYLTAVDAASKKIIFLRQLCRALDLQNVKCVAARLEPQVSCVSSLPGHSFDVIVSRAVGSIPYLLELAAPFLAPGGYVLLQRGHIGKQEISDDPRLLWETGFQVVKIAEVNFSFFTYPRNLIIFAKFST